MSKNYINYENDVEKLWAPYEEIIESWDDFLDFRDELEDKYPNRKFAWRGMSNASFPLHSYLYRTVYWKHIQGGGKEPPREETLLKHENELLSEARKWGLQSGSRGRIPVFELLAQLQHYRVPTRLIDITFNPLIGLYFVVQETKKDDIDGRIFALDITGRSITGSEQENWLNEFHLPWDSTNSEDEVNKGNSEGFWKGNVYVWRPSGFDKRIAAQHGGFIFGGVPSSKANIQWPKKPGKSQKLVMNELLQATSIPLRPHLADKSGGKNPKKGNALFTARIAGDAKKDIRDRLSEFNITSSILFPDVSGFSEYGAHLSKIESPW